MTDGPNSGDMPDRDPADGGDTFDQKLRGAVRAEMREWWKDEAAPDIAEAIKSVRAEIPTVEKVVDAIRERARQAEAQKSNAASDLEGAGPKPGDKVSNDTPQEPDNRTKRQRLGEALLDAPVQTLIDLVKGVADVAIDWKRASVESQSPLHYVSALQEQDPLLARFVGSLLAPSSEPPEDRLFAMAERGFDVGTRLTRSLSAGKSRRGRETANPTGPGPNSSGESTDRMPEPTAVAAQPNASENAGPHPSSAAGHGVNAKPRARLSELA